MAAHPAVCRILLIHKDPVLIDRVRGFLSALRSPVCPVALYTHLTDALTFLKVAPVDLILVGPQSNESDLETALGRLTANFPTIPVIALLDEVDARRRGQALAAGAHECLGTDSLNTELWTRTFEFCLRDMDRSVEMAEVTARLDIAVNTDPLTGLLNRTGLEREVMSELTRCRAAGQELMILLADLDDFGRINNTLGHGVGDLILVSAARRIGETVRHQDLVGRCGVDCFVIVMPGIAAEEAETIAENIRLAIGRDVIQAGDHTICATASLGLTAVSSTALSFDEVLARAQFVLQRSKQAGKNQVMRAATLQEIEDTRPVETGPDMVRALLRGQVLEVCHQPIVNLRDSRIVSHEMLIRGPEGPLHRPDNLFRYCQEKDIITAVDLRCLKLCAAAAAHLPGGARYHVNIMPATLLQTPPEELIRVLNVASNFGHCCLEISEQQLLSDPSVLAPCVTALQKAGIRIAIDDVGFGNSCLEGLIVLQPQIMKVDKRLVQGLAKDRKQRHSLARLLKVADVLGAEVVAEGIEEAEDYRVLLELGVRFGQGYLFGRPQNCDREQFMMRVDKVSDVAPTPDPRLEIPPTLQAPPPSDLSTGT